MLRHSDPGWFIFVGSDTTTLFIVSPLLQLSTFSSSRLFFMQILHFMNTIRGGPHLITLSTFGFFFLSQFTSSAWFSLLACFPIAYPRPKFPSLYFNTSRTRFCQFTTFSKLSRNARSTNSPSLRAKHREDVFWYLLSMSYQRANSCFRSESEISPRSLPFVGYGSRSTSASGWMDKHAFDSILSHLWKLDTICWIQIQIHLSSTQYNFSRGVCEATRYDTIDRTHPLATGVDFSLLPWPFVLFHFPFFS